MSAEHKIRKGESVDDWLKRLPGPQAVILAKLRELIISNAPELEEKVMWSQPWYVGNDKVFYLGFQNAYATFGVCNGAHHENPDGLLEGTGKNMRHVKVPSFEDVPKSKLVGVLERALAYDKTLG